MGEQSDLDLRNNHRQLPTNTTDRLLTDIYYEMRTANEKLSAIERRMDDIDMRITKLQANPWFTRMFGGKQGTPNGS